MPKLISIGSPRTPGVSHRPGPRAKGDDRPAAGALNFLQTPAPAGMPSAALSAVATTSGVMAPARPQKEVHAPAAAHST